MMKEAGMKSWTLGLGGLFLFLGASLMGAEAKPRPASDGVGTVTIPLVDYDRLVERAARPAKTPEPAPLSAAVATAVMRVHVDERAAQGSLDLTGEVYRPGAQKIALIANAMVIDAQMGAKPLPLLLDGANHCAVLSGPADFSLKLNFVAPIVEEPGRASLTLPMPLSRTARLFVTLPRPQADVRLEGGLIQKSVTVNGETQIEAVLDPGRAPRVIWTVRDRQVSEAAREARWLSIVQTLVTLGEAELKLVVLLDINVVEGRPDRFQLRLPKDFEMTSASGATLEDSAVDQDVLTLKVADAARRRHQFLISLEQAKDGALTSVDVPLLAVEGAQRETGEVAVEAIGTMEVGAKEEGTLQRLDVREVSGTLRATARHPLVAAFRFHRRPAEPPKLNLTVQKFPDAPVLAAVAESARATTLLTAEGRTLTEVVLKLNNHGQPFLKVGLSEGAQILTAEVAGERVKPVLGADGTRIPLLRTGFRPTDGYEVSFVYLASFGALGKKGEARLKLPSIDIPVALMRWEVFVPERYKVGKCGGDAQMDFLWDQGAPGGIVGGVVGGLSDQIVTEQINISSHPMAQNSAAQMAQTLSNENRQAWSNTSNMSANISSLQRRAAGILPVQVDIPRSGLSHHFIRPLVLNEETTVTFAYKAR
jgi:hypothetical protein